MIRNWLRNFMIGRYGPDHLNFFIIILAFIFNIAASITRLRVLLVISYLLLFLLLFRFLSRNITKRRAENDKFLKYWSPIKQKAKNAVMRLKSRKSYKFYKCPSCKSTLRVPKGKGKIQITCPKCGERFEKKT